jgi:hypothetical protein
MPPFFENIPLYFNDLSMTSFESGNDPILLEVLRHLNRLAMQATNIVTALNAGKHPGGVRVLSLDGGAVKGLFSVIVLEKVIEEITRG